MTIEAGNVDPGEVIEGQAAGSTAPETGDSLDQVMGSRPDSPNGPSIAFSFLSDIRSGVAGVVPRIVLSVAAAIGLVAAVLLVLGTFAAWTPPLKTFSSDGAISMGLAAAAFGWVFALAWIWTPYDRRLRRPVGAGLAFVGVWLICLVVCVAVEAMVGPERAKWLLQTGCVLVAANLTLLGGLRLIYPSRAAGPVAGRSADVAVHCPRCGYSMKGLTECRCPECGTAYAIDTLVHLQHARPRREKRAAETHDAPMPDAAAPRGIPESRTPASPRDAPDLPPSGLALDGPAV